MSTKPSRSRIVVLRLSPKALAAFPHEEPVEAKPEASPSSSTSSPPNADPVEPTPSLKPSDSADTPAPNDAAANDTSSADPSAQPVRRKGIPGPKPGTKRNLQQANDGVPKPRGKPGPKKKPRPGEMIGGVPFSGPVPMTAAKLNPKANQGAINANLRALDRSGKPCRKWERKGFQLKSFTGVSWAAPSWKTPPKTLAELSGDVKSDSSSDVHKPTLDSSIVPSEGSVSKADGEVDTPMADAGIASSPAPVISTAA